MDVHQLKMILQDCMQLNPRKAQSLKFQLQLLELQIQIGAMFFSLVLEFLLYIKITQLVSQFLGSLFNYCPLCVDSITDPNSITRVYILGYLQSNSNGIIIHYDVSSKSIVRESMLATNMYSEMKDIQINFNNDQIFVLVDTYSLKFSGQYYLDDCLLVSVNINTLNGKNISSHFGTQYDDQCNSLAVNRYNCGLMWSKEFGTGGYRDDCPDVDLSYDGFLAFVVGGFYNSLAQQQDMFILTLSVVDGSVQNYRSFGSSGDDKLIAIKHFRSTLFILGDQFSWYQQTATEISYDIFTNSIFAMKINVDQNEFSCFKTNETLSTTLFRDNSGYWKSDQKLIDFKFQIGGYLVQSINVYSADTNSELIVQLTSFCNGAVPSGISQATFTNYSSFPAYGQVYSLANVDNKYGFFFEKAKNQLNGQPEVPGDFGIRFAYSVSGNTIAFYSFLHVSATGQNEMNVVYLDDAILLRDYNQDSQYLIGIPLTMTDCSGYYNNMCNFTLTVVDITGGVTSNQAYFRFVNNQPVILKDNQYDIYCQRVGKILIYQVPFEKLFLDPDYQSLTPDIKTNGIDGLNINKVTFDYKTSNIIGYPDAVKVYQVQVKANDQITISNGFYGIQIEVTESNPIVMAQCVNNLIPINYFDIVIDNTNFQKFSQIDYSKCLPKPNQNSYYDIKILNQNITNKDPRFTGGCYKYSIFSQITFNNKLALNITKLELTAYQNQQYYFEVEDFQKYFMKDDIIDLNDSGTQVILKVQMTVIKQAEMKPKQSYLYQNQLLYEVSEGQLFNIELPRDLYYSPYKIFSLINSSFTNQIQPQLLLMVKQIQQTKTLNSDPETVNLLEYEYYYPKNIGNTNYIPRWMSLIKNNGSMTGIPNKSGSIHFWITLRNQNELSSEREVSESVYVQIDLEIHPNNYEETDIFPMRKVSRAYLLTGMSISEQDKLQNERNKEKLSNARNQNDLDNFIQIIDQNNQAELEQNNSSFEIEQGSINDSESQKSAEKLENIKNRLAQIGQNHRNEEMNRSFQNETSINLMRQDEENNDDSLPYMIQYQKQPEPLPMLLKNVRQQRFDFSGF
ncbi:UNKNOWN [Stylonychia lemnae]|uniref:Uncharacterized protein n=1 Tax=Stylonychia lemnae TaxID=5949 RepID=A0A078AUN3_STYLE|nr:UNKNOWN [Stylonychia lemnae]|eukprot:CDW84947.1 UNKNOWN [Stylonychia lemnae]